MTAPLRKAVIPAAGFGTRFLPFAKSVPKELVPLVDKPVIQYVVEEAAAAGLEEVLIILSAGKEAIRAHFDPSPELERRLAERGREAELSALRAIREQLRIEYVCQRELDGLGGAVKLAREFTGGEPFALLLGDTVVEGDGEAATRQLRRIYERYGAGVVALEEVPPEKVSRYGVIDGEEVAKDCYAVRNLVEKPAPEAAPSNLVIASRYILPPEIFAALDRTGRGKNDELQLTDAMKLLLTDRPFYGLRFAGRRYDLGNKLEFLKSTVEFGLRRDEFGADFRKFLQTVLKD